MAAGVPRGTGPFMIPARDIKLLLSDVDGTLVTHDKVLTDAARAAAGDLRQAGIGLTVTSARPPLGVRMLIEPLGLNLPLAGFNGGLIVDPEFKVLESHPIDAQAARTAVKLLRDGGLDVWAYTETDWFVGDPGRRPPSRARPGSSTCRPRRRRTSPTSSWRAPSRSSASRTTPPRSPLAAGEAQARLGGAVSATSSAAYFLDITHPKATKGFVVHSLARQLGLSAAQIATIGDMPNDVLMFRESGFSIAMGNAGDAVKAQANAVTDSNEDDGFAKAVRRFLLQSNAA